MVALFAIAEAIARVCPSSILDASSWNGRQVRYLFPVFPAFAAFGFIGASIIVQRVARPLCEHSLAREG